MALEQKLNLKLSQRLVMTPSLQQAIKMLQMTRLELRDAITQEMVENPVLEEPTEPDDEDEARSSTDPPESAEPVAEQASGELERDSFEEIEFDAFFQDYLDSGYNPIRSEEREELPIENTLTESEDLPGHLLWQLGLSAAAGTVREIAEFLVGNVDADGYLRLSPEEIRAGGAWPETDIEAALALVRSFDPPGVCALDLRECLRLQVAALGISNSVVTRILDTHWDRFLARQFPALMKELSVSPTDLQVAVDILRGLETKPGRLYTRDRAVYIEADVVVRRVGDDYVVQIEDDGLPKLRLSRAYRRMLQGGAQAVGREARDYLRERMRSAVWLLKSLDQRQRTIYKVAESIVRHQRGYFDRGIEALRPLVLRDVASDIGMHESTVSRVVSNKYMDTPRGLLPMKYFFHTGIDSSAGEDVSSLSIKNKIGRMITEENTRHPLSDASIMERLRNEGIQIARRTVAKYREELRIPSSNDRKALL